MRVDAVSNMLYLNYGKDKGEWRPNIFGDNGSLEAIQFIKELNTAVKKEAPNTMMIAEESTSWSKISKPISEGGLGFDFKWNMGWMHDTLDYIKEDAINRKYHHNKMTFSMMYHYSENFILPISHDEVVYGKKSLVDKMWGDNWNKYAGLRLYAANMIGHPGKKLFAINPKSSELNERNTLVVKDEKGREVLFRQIAGVMARRIICNVDKGAPAKVGEEFGLIRFGSRVDFFLPIDSEINVKIGDKVKGKISVLAHLK